MIQYGPISVAADQLHAEKYRGPGESFREAMTRIASTLCDNDEHFKIFRQILLEQRFLPGGRIQSAIGSLKATTPYNCFVSGTIEDSYTEGTGSIMARASQAATTMRMGGGIGYDFSTLRPEGTQIRKLGSKASGPVSFMDIFDSICKVTASAGDRRGAQMGVLRVDHPDIEHFIRAKANATKLTGFNISIAVTDAFMEAVASDGDFPLIWNNTIYRIIRARDLWNLIMRNNYDWGEPGILFIDRINRLNNLYYCETIAATNPCGEQPLPPYGACLLGSFNLTKYLNRNGPNTAWWFDYAQFFEDIPYVVRAMDNVIDCADYPLFEQEQEAKAKRRMGLGVTGVANTIEALGFPYGSDKFITYLHSILSGLRTEAYRSSCYLAKEKGAFPKFNPTAYLQGEYVSKLPLDVRDLIRENGIRNSHLISIAPTGTISLTADNVSSGIEPVFSYKTKRWIIDNAGRSQVDLYDYGYKYLNVSGKTAAQCTVDDHLKVLITASRYVDSAVSKTCNVPTDYNWEDFKNIYIKAWKENCKGCTTFRMNSLREGILEEVNLKEEETILTIDSTYKEENVELTCEVDPLTGRKNCE